MNDFFQTKDGKPVFLTGLQSHNSSTGTFMMQKTIKAIKHYGGNVLEAPIYWNNIEPAENIFDFSLVKKLICDARFANLYLLILWFGSSKNGHPNYVPEYIKQNPQKYELAKSVTGAPVMSISPHCHATLAKDKRAFTKLMEFIRSEDEKIGTVLGIQVENEIGLANTDRDYGPTAETDYQRPVPAVLKDIVLEDCGEISGENTWRGRFGRHAHEAFCAWYHGVYVEEIASAGKQIYPLPMLVNVMVGEHGMEEAGLDYSGGAAVGRVLDIWKKAAPSIDLLCPDLYCSCRDEYERICKRYKRPDNPLFIPESSCHFMANALNMFRAVANFDAIGVCGFGAESALKDDGTLLESAIPVATSMHILSSVAPLLIRYHMTGKIHALIQEEFMSEQYLRLENYHVLAKYFSLDNDRMWLGSTINLCDPDNSYVSQERGRALLFETGESEFFLAGTGVHVSFLRRPAPLDEASYSKLTSRAYGQLNFLSVEEGHFENDNFVVDYVRNGDEANGLVYVHIGQVVRIRLNPNL